MYIALTDTLRERPVIPTKGNVSCFASIQQFEGRIPFRGLSMKYVIGGGNEYYKINGASHYIAPGNYLLANHTCEGFGFMDAQKAVQSVCIDLSMHTLAEAIDSFNSDEAGKGTWYADIFFNHLDFGVRLAEDRTTRVGRRLKAIGAQWSARPFENYTLDNEFYFTLALDVVLDHEEELLKHKVLQPLSYRDHRQIVKRASIGKWIIDQSFTETLSMADIAQQCYLSEFQFFRLFQKIYGISPYQYQLRKRMHYAHYLLQRRGLSITQAAYECGYADISAFSKAFKKVTGFAPGTLRYA